MSDASNRQIVTNGQTYNLLDDGVFPNNPRWPLVVYPARAIDEGSSASAAGFESLFHANAWPPQWRSGIFDFHHYHSTSHEVLGVFAGHAEIQFGGDKGLVIECKGGDVIIIPAGVAHRCLSSGDGFCCVGAYPAGSDWDVLTAQDDDRVAAATRVARVAAPTMDPVHGAKTSLFRPDRGY